MAMEAPLFFRLAELTAPLPLSNKRRFADAGEFGGLGVGVVFEEFHRVVELLSVEFWRTAFAEIRVGRTGDDEHIAAPQLRPQPVPVRLVHLGAGERVRVDFFRAGAGSHIRPIATLLVSCLFGTLPQIKNMTVRLACPPWRQRDGLQ